MVIAGGPSSALPPEWLATTTAMTNATAATKSDAAIAHHGPRVPTATLSAPALNRAPSSRGDATATGRTTSGGSRTVWVAVAPDRLVLELSFLFHRSLQA
jgi:hypothetical protein